MATQYAQSLQSTPASAESRDYKAFRTLYLMLGGSGMKTGMHLRKRVLAAHGVAQLPFQEFLWLDTDRGDLRSQTIDDTREMANRLALHSDDVVDLSLPFARVQSFRSNPQNFPWLASWLNPELLDDLGHSARAEAGAAQIRALGRLAFEANFQDFRTRLMRKYERLLRPSLGQECKPFGYEVDGQSVEVVVLCSLAGGTGSGCFLQAARVVRALMREVSVHTTAYLYLPGVYREVLEGPHMWEDVQANAYAALKELNALASNPRGPGGAGGVAPLWIDDFKVERPVGDPFNQIYLVDARNEQMTLDTPRDQDAYGMVADALFFDFEQSAFGTAKRSHRCNVGPHLANTTLLSVPVEDGTRRADGPGDEVNGPFQTGGFASLGGGPTATGGFGGITATGGFGGPTATGGHGGGFGGAGRKPHYVFRFPNAFGCFGLSRVPFDRQRLQRAAGAWLGERMFALWIEPPDKRLPWREVLDTVVTPRMEAAGLTAEAVVNQLLTGPDGRRWPEAHRETAQTALEALRAEVQAHFGATGLAPTERLERLRTASAWGRDLRTRAQAIVHAGRDAVQHALTDAGARSAWGPELRAMLDAQEAISARYRDDLRTFVVELMAEPRRHGLEVAEQALDILHDELHRAAEAPPPEVPPLDLPGLDLDPGPEVLHAAELRAEADALILPVYQQLARAWSARRHRDLLARTARACAGECLAFLDDLAHRFDAFVEARYRRVARERCRTLLRALSGYVGERTEVDQQGAVVVRTTGLRTELRLFREAVEHARGWFAGLHQSYRKTRTSRRNGADLTPFEGLEAGVVAALSGSAGASADPEVLPGLLSEAWRRFVQETGLLAEGEGDPLHLGLRALMARAVERPTRAQATKAVEDALEDWAVQRLVKARYLAGQDAVQLLLARGEAQAFEQLDLAGRGAVPWLNFDRAHGTPRGLQPLALVGTPHVDSPLLTQWARRQSGALAGARPIQNDSGSVVLYAERMAFPLFCVAALDELESAYDAVAARGTFELLRRHTVADHLDLPVLRPPRDPEQAGRWFKIDRLALEAVLLNVFEAGAAGKVQYTFFEAQSHVRNHFQVPGTLSAIAAKLREDALLLTAVRRAVEQRTLRVFAERESALHALRLALWTQNFAFPRRTGATLTGAVADMEHELAASVTRLWREAAEQRQQIPWHEQVDRAEAVAPPQTFALPSPVLAHGLSAEVPGLLSLPPRLYGEGQPALRRVF